MEAVNVPLYGKRNFADVVKLRILIIDMGRLSCIIWMNLNVITSILVKGGQREI